MTQDEIDVVKKNAVEQGIDLTQITVFYKNTEDGPIQHGQFTPDGIPLDSDGSSIPPEKITGFYYLGGD